MARALRAWAINQREKTRIHNLQYRPRKLGKIFIISLRLTGARARKLVKAKRKVQLPQRMPCQNPKNEIFLAVKFEIVACKIQTVFSSSLCNRNDMKNSLDDCFVEILNLAGCTAGRTVEYGPLI